MAHSYSVDRYGNIYKNGNFVPAENYKYLYQDPYGQQAIEAARKLKSGNTGYTGWSTSRGWVVGSTGSSSSSSGSSSTSGGSSGTGLIPDRDEVPDIIDNRSTGLTGGLNNYSVPYEQTLRDLLSQFQGSGSSWNPLSESEKASRASNYADIITNPILEALNQRLETARTSTENAISNIQSQYSGAKDEVEAVLEELGRVALEDAIARGAGRSGVVNWERQQMQEPVMRDFDQMMAEMSSQISGLQNDLATEERLIEQARQNAIEQRAKLEQQYLSELEQLDRTMSQSSQSGLWGMAMQLAQLVNNANTNQQNLMASMLPWLIMSPSSLTQLYGSQY